MTMSNKAKLDGMIVQTGFEILVLQRAGDNGRGNMVPPSVAMMAA